MSSHAPNAQPAPAGPRCLLFVPRGCDAPIDLIAGLAARRLYVREISTAPGVMAELARKSYTILIAVFPGHAADWPALLEAVRIYHPSISIWTYDACNPLRLNRLPASPHAAAPQTPELSDDQDIQDGPAASHHNPQNIGAPAQTRQTPQPSSSGAIKAPRAMAEPLNAPAKPAKSSPPNQIAAPKADRSSSTDPSDHQPLVTEEELAMLLGDEPLP